MATCNGSATPEYEFWIWTPDAGWTLAQAFSTTSTFNWDTTGLTAGTYAMQVDARAQGAPDVESYTGAHYDLQ